MNDHDHDEKLPYLNDDDIKFCYAVCERANLSDGPPIKALFATYDAAACERGLNPKNELTYFPWILRVSNSVKKATEAAYPKQIHVDLVLFFKGVLEACGITVLEPSEYGDDDQVLAGGPIVPSAGREVGKRASRRVSFDEARYEETWLSGHTESLLQSPARPSLRQLLRQDAGSSNSARIPGRRTRSASLQRSSERQIVGEVRRQDYGSQANKDAPAAGPSETELEIKVDAFQSITELRLARQALYSWYDEAQRLKQHRVKDHTIATSYDRRTLLRQAFDGWRANLADILTERRRTELEEKKFDDYDKKAVRVRDLMLVRKCFTHWAFQTEDEKLRTAVAHRHVLRYTYFHRWRAIAAENQAKVRSILSKKYIAIWKTKVGSSRVAEECAVSYRKTALLRKYKNIWFWAFCDHRVEGWHEQWVERRTMRQLADTLRSRRTQQARAKEVYCSRLTRQVFRTLVDKHRALQGSATTALQHFQHAIERRGLTSLQKNTTLAPLARTVQQSIARNTVEKALRVWQLHLSLSREAVHIDRQRLLQTAWTDWNDALRCKALAQKINERILVENLYRWVLQERLRLFQRTAEDRLLSRALAWWSEKAKEERDRLGDAEIVFAERQRRRQLASAMRQLHGAVRTREDGERAAVEFAMSRALPRALETWTDKASHLRTLARWAVDARFYCLSTVALKKWKDRTAENVAKRRRDAYIQIRARIKFRLAKTCIERLRTANAQVQYVNEEAARRSDEKKANVAIAAFHRWQERASRNVEITAQAIDHDKQKLLGSALEAIMLKYADTRRMDLLQQDFHRDTNLALLAGALRRVQWATFTANRRVESADALWARNRDQHVRHMLRHWATQTVARRARTDDRAQTPEQEVEYPESPSIRPASRAASRSALQDSILPSSPPMQDLPQSTPGYMRTPSRPRRGGRFRPLNTPAAITPMAFDPAYLVTTPAPLLVMEDDSRTEAHERSAVEGLTPQITPFSRKLRAGGITAGGIAPSSALRRPDFARSTQGGTNKSVRFAGSNSRFKDSRHIKNS